MFHKYTYVCSLQHPACIHELCMCHIVICHLSHSTTFFHTISWTAPLKKSYWTWNVCFDFLHNFLPETLLILRRNVSDMIKSVCWTSCKVPVHQIFNETWISLTSNSLKFSQCEPSCSTWVDSQTNMRRLVVTFHNFVNAPKKCTHNWGYYLGRWKHCSSLTWNTVKLILVFSWKYFVSYSALLTLSSPN